MALYTLPIPLVQFLFILKGSFVSYVRVYVRLRRIYISLSNISASSIGSLQLASVCAVTQVLKVRSLVKNAQAQEVDTKIDVQKSSSQQHGSLTDDAASTSYDACEKNNTEKKKEKKQKKEPPAGFKK